MTFKVIQSVHTHEEEIKKSLFVGICAPISSVADFETFYKEHADPDATHNCWAYRIGQTYRFNDDGEPSGTAGKPILSAIDGAGFDHIAALVIRYYGGIKLGTGGLARAYGGSIARNLQHASYTHHIPTANCQISVPFAHSQYVHQCVKQHQGTILSQDFNADGVLMVVQIPEHEVPTFTDLINNSTKGQAEVKLLED